MQADRYKARLAMVKKRLAALQQRVPASARVGWPDPDVDLTAADVAEACCDEGAFPWRSPNDLCGDFKLKLEFYLAVQR